jgi:two-component system phosphate regulon response regulator PhoB
VAEARRTGPDLILLDRMLPGLSGDEVIAQLKREPKTTAIPTIMLTAKGEESDALVGFALGADDYVTKPFSMKLLLARIAAVLRRGEGPAPQEQVLTTGGVCLDVGRHEVTLNEQNVPVTTMEFRILQSLMAGKGRVLSRAQLIEAATGTGVVVSDRTIDVHIVALRKKLGDAGGWVQTIRGVGYAFREPLAGEE